MNNQERMLRINIGKKIKLARTNASYTQEQLAEKLSLSPRYISQLERGIAFGSATTITNLCKALNINSDFLFNDLSKDYDIIIIDQPEDYISSTKITQELLKYIKQVRDYKQIIIATHNPLLVVNLDVDNVICLNKNYKNEITVKDGCLEYNCQEYKIIDEVADIMDGGKEAVERRFRLYGN